MILTVLFSTVLPCGINEFIYYLIVSNKIEIPVRCLSTFLILLWWLLFWVYEE